MKDDDILNAGAGRRHVRVVAAALRRPVDLGGESADRRRRSRSAARCSQPTKHHAQLHALLAPQDAGDLRATTQWFAGMDECRLRRRSRETLRETALRGIEATQFFPRWGKARLHGMIANRPDWTLRASASGACRCRSSCTRRPASCIRARWSCSSRSRSASRRAASRPGSASTARGLLGADADAVRQDHATRSTSGSTRAPRTSPCCAARTRPQSTYPGRPVPRRLGPAPRLVPLVAADRLHAGRPCAVQGAAHARLRRRRRRPQDVEVAGQRASRRRRSPSTLGAEILRLWVAATDYSGELVDLRRDPEARGRELPAHPQHAALPARQHRRTSIRRSDAVPLARDGRDRPLRARADARSCRTAVARGLRSATSSTWWSQQLQTFCSEDLGAFYLDMLKDRLYTHGAESQARRSAQTALWHITHSAAAADGADPVVHRRGAWQVFTGQARTTACSSRPGTSCRRRPTRPALMAKWKRAARAARRRCARRSRSCAPQDKVGSSLQAEVELRAEGAGLRVAREPRRRAQVRC